MGDAPHAVGRRQLDVTAHTTLDHAEGQVRGSEWAESGLAVLDATVPREAPERVTLALEFDPGALEHVPSHVDRLELSPEQARTVAADLEAAAEAAEAGESRTSGRGR